MVTLSKLLQEKEKEIELVSMQLKHAHTQMQRHKSDVRFIYSDADTNHSLFSSFCSYALIHLFIYLFIYFPCLISTTALRDERACIIVGAGEGVNEKQIRR
jgi:hypothetical protein